MKVRLTCDYCGVAFERYQSQAGKFCSKTCFVDARKRALKNCSTCGCEFSPRSQRSRFCSLPCRDKGQERGNRAHVKRKHLYGLSEHEHAAMVDAHVGFCAICLRERPLVIDHDHDTGAVRGLVCRKCNTGLGMFEDQPLFLEQAVRYLDRNGRGLSVEFTTPSPIVRCT